VAKNVLVFIDTNIFLDFYRIRGDGGPDDPENVIAILSRRL